MAAVDAAIAQVGSAACALAILPLEDALALPEQPNLPGTVDAYPSWRIPLAVSLEEFFGRVAEKQGTGETLAEKHARIVLSILGRAVDNGELSDMRSQLPKDFQPLLESEV